MISINATFFVQVVNFLVLMVILDRLLFRPIFRIMEEREKVVVGARQEMTRLEEEAQNKTHEIEAQIRLARQEAAKQRDVIQARASDQADEIVNRAIQEAGEHIHSVQREVQKEVSHARQGLEDVKGPLIGMVLSKVMGRDI